MAKRMEEEKTQQDLQKKQQDSIQTVIADTTRIPTIPRAQSAVDKLTQAFSVADSMTTLVSELDKKSPSLIIQTPQTIPADSLSVAEPIAKKPLGPEHKKATPYIFSN